VIRVQSTNADDEIAARDVVVDELRRPEGGPSHPHDVAFTVVHVYTTG